MYYLIVLEFRSLKQVNRVAFLLDVLGEIRFLPFLASGGGLHSLSRGPQPR